MTKRTSVSLAALVPLPGQSDRWPTQAECDRLDKPHPPSSKMGIISPSPKPGPSFFPPFNIGLPVQEVKNFVFTRPRYAPWVLYSRPGRKLPAAQPKKRPARSACGPFFLSQERSSHHRGNGSRTMKLGLIAGGQLPPMPTRDRCATHRPGRQTRSPPVPALVLRSKKSRWKRLECKHAADPAPIISSPAADSL